MKAKAKHEKYSWAQDSNGDRYFCVYTDRKKHSHDYEKLDREEKARCKAVEFPWN